MKRILIYTPGFYPLLGGMEEQVYLLSKEFIRQNYKVDVLTEQTKPSFKLFEKYEGINVYRLKIYINRIFSFPLIFFSAIFFLLFHKYDLIVVRTFTLPVVIVGLLKRLHFLSTPTIVTAETGGENDDVIKIKKLPLSTFILFLIKGNDYFNSICADNYRHLLELSFPVNKLTRIYNGIVFDEYQKLKYPKKVHNFLFLGQLNKEKGIWELINAVEELHSKDIKIKLFIGGDGPEKEQLKKYIETKKLGDTVFYQGRINREEKNDFFLQGECLVLPSYSEGFPLVIIEAAKYKKVILVTDVSDIKKIYGNRVFYCKKKDVKSLKEQIFLLMNRDISPKLNYDDIKKICDIRNTANQFLSLIS